MPFDPSLAEPVPTRRSSRQATAPSSAVGGTVGLTRAELRRRAAGNGTAGLGATDKRITVDADPVAPIELSATQPLVPAKTIDPVATASETIAEAPAPARALHVSVTTPDAAPLRRRRVRTASQPVVDTALPADTGPVEKPVVEAVVFEGSVADASAAEAQATATPAAASTAVETPATEAPATESPATETPAAEPPVGEAATDEPEIDEFERAAQLFQFTGESPVVKQEAEPAASVDESLTNLPTEAIGTVPSRSRSTFKRVAAASFSFTVIGVVGLLAMGTAMPAEALAASSAGSSKASLSVIAPADEATEVEPEEIQAYVAPVDAQGEVITREDGYATTTVQQIAAETGIRYSNSVFSNDQNAAIQWPYAVGVAMSSGYGYRWGRLHEGLDFVPGEGAPIQSIADGVVRVASEAGGAYGVHVYIDHEIDGQIVTSHYAHMQYGSLQVSPGQAVTVGQVIGRTGNTGRSYGAHLHFELAVNGTTIDPLPWLRKYAGG